MLAIVPSTSVAVKPTLIGVSSLPVALLDTATGASLTGVTVMLSVLVLVKLPSETV